MIIGVAKEIKKEEYRVAMTPAGVRELKQQGHTVLVEPGAGLGSGFSDSDYLSAEADMVDRNVLFGSSELIVKVKEPLREEYELLREGSAVFTYLHLAANRELTECLLARKITGMAYETLEKDGGLPLLAPMSEIAGRMAPLVAAYYLQRFRGGTGVLFSGATGVRPARAVVLGAGVVGFNAARVCAGMGLETVVLNRGLERLQRLDEVFLGRVRTSSLTTAAVSEEIRDADIIICGILLPGGKTPVLITREMLRTMKKGSVIVDVSVDQGGCAETSRPATHDDPIYEVDGIIHYTVSNMPGAYPCTSTLALTNATLPYLSALAELGIERAVREDIVLRTAVNTYGGVVTNRALAVALGLACSGRALN